MPGYSAHIVLGLLRYRNEYGMASKLCIGPVCQLSENDNWTIQRPSAYCFRWAGITGNLLHSCCLFPCYIQSFSDAANMHTAHHQTWVIFEQSANCVTGPLIRAVNVISLVFHWTARDCFKIVFVIPEQCSDGPIIVLEKEMHFQRLNDRICFYRKNSQMIFIFLEQVADWSTSLWTMPGLSMGLTKYKMAIHLWTVLVICPPGERYHMNTNYIGNQWNVKFS